MAERSGSDRDKGQKAKGKGPAWMGTGASTPARRSTAQWTAAPTRERDPEARSRAVRALVILTAAALFAGFVYFVLTRLEPTPVISLRASAYPLQMPPLAFAEEDADLLARISPRNVRVIPVEMKSSTPALEEFRKSLKTAGRSFSRFRRGSDVVMVSIAGHGIVNEANQPCLVPPNEDPFDSNSWLPLAKVLEAIRDEETLRGKHKLVLLDCQRVLSCWRCGWLESHFFDTVSTAVKEANDPNLFVLSAADAGQVNWAAPELRASVFGHFLARGMRGEGSQGSGVSLLELVRYVGDSVNAYSSSRQRRSVRQEPKLWHSDRGYHFDGKRLVDADGQAAKIEDFTLAYVDRWKSRTKIDELRSAHDPLTDAKRLIGQASLNQVWQRFRERREVPSGDSNSLPAYVVDPVAWSSIQDRLAAIGERLFAGHEYQGTTLQTEIQKLATDLNNDDAWRPRGPLPKFTLLQAVRQTAKVGDSGQPASSENLFKLYLKTEAAKRDEVLPKRAEMPRLLRDVYAALTEGAGSSDARANIRTAHELFDRYRQPGNYPLVEEHFLQLLSGGLVPGETVTSQQMATALKARELSSQAASPLDLRIHYAIEPLVNASDEKLREAEDLFLLGTEMRRCETLWKDATADSPGSGYAAVVGLEGRLAESYRLRDEIWADWPLVAEWICTQGKANSFTSPAAALAKVMENSIELDDALERVVRSRDEAGTFRAQLERTSTLQQDLFTQWRGAMLDLEGVYHLPTNVEQTYRRGEDVRNAEVALRFPPLVGSSNQFVELYLQTLDRWISEGPDTVAAATDRTETPPTPASTSTDRRQLLRELHHVLTYEFVDPYSQHRYAEAWTNGTSLDVIFRSGAQDSAWLRIRKLLDAYNEAISTDSPLWDQSRRAVSATTKLRQWDRRVRVAGPWLSSFQSNLQISSQATQRTPTRWLQEYDAAHWSAWQAYRAERDFWGNGQRPSAASTRPYFATLIDQCEAVLPESMRPIRYDIPGGGIADFAQRSPTALAALDRWEPFSSPRSSRSGDAATGATKIDLTIQPQPGDPLRLPTGVATLSFQSPTSAILGAFDTAGQAHTRQVPLPMTTKEPTPVIGYARLQPDTSPAAAQLDARLWYRGHVRTKLIPLPNPDSLQFVEYEALRPNYGPPTVEVRGTNAVRGAVVFVFDCSSSMRARDGRFEQAKRALGDILTELDRDSGPNLKVGLMTYGRRTPADGEPPIFYSFTKMPNDSTNLTDLGKAERERLGVGPFSQRYPHPDRDVEFCTPVATSTAADAAKELAKFQFAQCRGCTPLYYSTQQALDRGFEGLPRNLATVRQIVVLSDGVNMPYDSSNGIIRPTAGLRVNSGDRAALESALKQHSSDTQVSVVLFGAQPENNVQSAQLDALDDIAATHANFRIFPVADPAAIARTIRNAFPKATLELRGPESSGLSQPMTFNQPLPVRDWPTDGMLRREPVRQVARLTPPGEIRPIDRELELIGGERVILQYDPREGQSLFIGDELTRRKSAPLQTPRPADPRRLLFDALDPERIGLTVSKFNFRIRDEDETHRFAARPKHAWIEVKPMLPGGESSERTFPCIDPLWKENINLPRLQMAVEKWPDCPSARVKAWLRYSDPLASATATIPRDRTSQLLSAGNEKWQIEQTTGDGGTPRKITAIWEPTDGQPSLQKLLDRAVWLTPPPDSIRRQYALDGSSAIHEFIYNRPDIANVEIRVVKREDFEQGAYYAELEFDTAN